MDSKERYDDLNVGDMLDVSFTLNRTVDTTGRVISLNEKNAVIQLNVNDEKMTPVTGTDIYILGKGLLLNVDDTVNFPNIAATVVTEREYARVDDFLKIDYALLTDDPKQNGASRLELFNKIFGCLPKVPEAESVDLKTLYNLLCQVNWKLDQIMESLPREKASSASSVYNRVNISASGLRFITDQPLAEGDTVAMRIHLPATGSLISPLDLTATVVSSSKSSEENRHIVSLKFTDLSEDNEEAIMKYVFRRQREVLRG
ncbi:MAG: PilZ domain-containing protein [Deltaproteobacteria bacterium]|nr:PilZ domain-containing protein [Deltaproteobacteria bacterium]